MTDSMVRAMPQKEWLEFCITSDLASLEAVAPGALLVRQQRLGSRLLGDSPVDYLDAYARAAEHIWMRQAPLSMGGGWVVTVPNDPLLGDLRQRGDVTFGVGQRDQAFALRSLTMNLLIERFAIHQRGEGVVS